MELLGEGKFLGNVADPQKKLAARAGGAHSGWVMTKLITLTWSHLRDEEIYELGVELETIVSDLGGAALCGADASRWTLYRKALKALDDALEPVRKNAMTAELVALDKQRSAAYSVLRNDIRDAVRFPGTASYHTKAVALWDIVRVYQTKKYLSYNQKTGVLHNLVNDLRTPPADGYYSDLKLNPDLLATTDDLNREFERVYLARGKEEAAVLRTDTRAARAELLARRGDLVETIAAGAVRETYKGKYVEFVNDYNELIAKYKTLIKVRAANSKRRKEQEEQGKGQPAPETPVGELDVKLSAPAKVVIKEERVPKKAGGAVRRK